MVLAFIYSSILKVRVSLKSHYKVIHSTFRNTNHPLFPIKSITRMCIRSMTTEGQGIPACSILFKFLISFSAHCFTIFLGLLLQYFCVLKRYSPETYLFCCLLKKKCHNKWRPCVFSCSKVEITLLVFFFLSPFSVFKDQNRGLVDFYCIFFVLLTNGMIDICLLIFNYI